MRTPFCGIARLAFLAAVVLLARAPAVAAEDQADAAIGAELARLKDGDIVVRIEALRGLMTSLDPRLPDALLPLLKDEGNSIRRLAARSIGSRWWQIADERVAVFVKALQGNAASKHDDEANMARRAIGLLRRKYDGDMFSRSVNKRWVIYERRGLPCLIDTKSGTEELLGWSAEGGDGWLAAAWSNTAVADSAFWHADQEVVALSLLLNRKASTVWFWRHGKGLRKLEVAEFAKVLGLAETDIFHPGGFSTEIDGWKDGQCRMTVYFNTRSGDDMVEHDAVVTWDMDTDTLRVISHQRGEG